jgi:hypothetical protein
MRRLLCVDQGVVYYNPDLNGAAHENVQPLCAITGARVCVRVRERV